MYKYSYFILQRILHYARFKFELLKVRKVSNTHLYKNYTHFNICIGWLTIFFMESNYFILFFINKIRIEEIHINSPLTCSGNTESPDGIFEFGLNTPSP